MPLTVTITPGYNYSKTGTVNDENLNALGNPGAEVADGQPADFASVLLAMGTASAPTLKGKSASSTGLFWDGVEMGIAVNGDECVRFTADGLELDAGRSFAGNLIAPAGTKAAPSISFEGKSGTGFWLTGSSMAASIDGTQVLASASTAEKEVREQLGGNGKGGNVDAATLVGKRIAEKAKAAGIEKVAFDRSGFAYHGRVKALADAAREAGLQF